FGGSGDVAERVDQRRLTGSSVPEYSDVADLLRCELFGRSHGTSFSEPWTERDPGGERRTGRGFRYGGGSAYRAGRRRRAASHGPRGTDSRDPGGQNERAGRPPRRPALPIVAASPPLLHDLSRLELVHERRH